MNLIPTRRGARFALTLLFLLLLPSLAVAIGCADVEPVALIPADGACDGLSVNGEPGQAHEFAELTVFVNGDAAMYMSYGFVAFAIQPYVADFGDGATDGDVKLFNQGSPENAAALYEHTNAGLWDDVPEWTGSGPVRARQSFGNTYLEFQERCFFVRIQIIGRDTPAALVGAQCLGEEICALLPAETPAEAEAWSEIKANYR